MAPRPSLLRPDLDLTINGAAITMPVRVGSDPLMASEIGTHLLIV
jgi:hypothetical protein